MLSLNVRGLSNFKKRRSIFAWCRKQNANIIFLQETHSTHAWKSECAPLELAHGSSNARAKFIKKTFITSFMTASMRGPFGTCLIFGGLTSAERI